MSTKVATIGVALGVTVDLYEASNGAALVVVSRRKERVYLTLAQAQELAELLSEAVAQAPELIQGA